MNRSSAIPGRLWLDHMAMAALVGVSKSLVAKVAKASRDEVAA